MKLFSVILLACIALGSCDDSVHSSSRILGGTAANIATYNYVVQLRRDHFGTGSWHQQCGGVLIHARLVLTSASCFQGVPYPLRWRVRGGTASRLDGGQERLVLEIIPNGVFNPISLQNNLAVVRLLTPMALGPNTNIAQLVPSGLAAITGNVNVLGWGATVLNGVPSTLLQMATVAIIAPQTCITNYANIHMFVGDGNICTGSTTGICTRDEGGPLVVGNVVHGIASFIYGCGFSNFPGVFTNISPLRAWIDGQIASIQP